MEITRLPIDMWREVFKWITQEDWSKCEQVCRTWFEEMSPFWEKEANRLRLELGQERVVKIDSKQINRKGFDALLPLLAAKAVSPKEVRPFLEAHPIVLTGALHYVGKLSEQDNVTRTWVRLSKKEGKFGSGLYIMREHRLSFELLHISQNGKCGSLGTTGGWPLFGQWETTFDWQENFPNGIVQREEHQLALWLTERWEWDIGEGEIVDSKEWMEKVYPNRIQMTDRNTLKDFNGTIRSLLHWFPELGAQAPHPYK